MPRQTPSEHSPSFWKRLPQWVNQFALAMQGFQLQAAKITDPQHIHLFFPPSPQHPNTLWNGIPYQSDHPWMLFITPEPPDQLDVASFAYALEQIPTAQSIEFSGWGDPLDHPDIFKMVNKAVQFNGMVTRLHTHGLNKWDIGAILTSPLDHLIIQMVAHRPSLYSAIVKTRQPLSLFTQREQQIKALIDARDHQHGRQSRLFVELTMVLDMMLLEHLPDMIEYGLSLGVDGIRFENYMDINCEPPSLQTLYNTPEISQHLTDVTAPYASHIRIELPPLLPHPHAGNTQQGRCSDPQTQVSLTPQLAVRPCSVQWAIPKTDNTIWNQHFWRHPDYVTLRQMHTPLANAHPNGEIDPQKLAISAPCQFCPKNSLFYSPLHHA